MKFCHLFSFLKIITDCKGKKIYQKLYGVVVIFFLKYLFSIVRDCGRCFYFAENKNDNWKKGGFLEKGAKSEGYLQ